MTKEYMRSLANAPTPNDPDDMRIALHGLRFAVHDLLEKAADEKDYLEAAMHGRNEKAAEVIELRKRIAALEAERDELKGKLQRASLDLLSAQEALEAERDAALAQVAKLAVARDALSDLYRKIEESDKWYEDGGMAIDLECDEGIAALKALNITARGAEAHEERIRADERENVVNRLKQRAVLCVGGRYMIPDDIDIFALLREIDSELGKSAGKMGKSGINPAQTSANES